MAGIEELVGQVADPDIRAELAREIARLKRNRRYGLVFERHIPESVLIANFPIKVGTIVVRRKDITDTPLRVVQADGNGVAVLPLHSEKEAEPEWIDLSDILALKRYPDPIYPTLTSLGALACGAQGRPYHAVIKAENLHALSLLVHLYERKVDCVYLDPPFNTGARDWKYNNRYVDRNDTYRHSKWLAMMDRRLREAKRLLKPDGILVVAVDENEHAHLVMLLEQLYREYNVTSVAIVHNPRGIQGDNFSYTNEFALFVIPKGQRLIARRPLAEDEQEAGPLRNWGGESERTAAANCFYAIYVRNGEIVGFGDVLPEGEHPSGPNEELADGRIAIWPIDANNIERKWRYARESVEGILPLLSVKRRAPGARPWDVFLTKGEIAYKTVWRDPLYDASTYGTQVVNRLIEGDFPFPKSLYAVYDILHACTANRKDALIVDFFAGSGTTLHAACLLNTGDNGSRRCILVTNNEVAPKTAASLNKAGFHRGDAEYEKEGIFEAVTRPRVTAALMGRRADGSPLRATWKYRRGDGRSWAEGFPENVEFFRLDYLDPTRVALGMEFAALLPVLWMEAGGIDGACESLDLSCGFALAPNSPFAILTKPSAVRALTKALSARPDVTHVFVLTDSERTFVDLRSGLPDHLTVVMLFRDYLRPFESVPEPVR